MAPNQPCWPLLLQQTPKPVCVAVPWAYQAIWHERTGKHSPPETSVERSRAELMSARAESFISMCAFMRGRHKERPGLCTVCVQRISPSGSRATDLSAHSAGGEGGVRTSYRSPEALLVCATAPLFTPRSRPWSPLLQTTLAIHLSVHFCRQV